MPEWHSIDWKWQRVWNYSWLAAYAAQQFCGTGTCIEAEKHE